MDILGIRATDRHILIDPSLTCWLVLHVMSKLPNG